RRHLGPGGGRALAELLRLERLDVFEAVHDPAADLDELRAFARPTPPLQRAMADVPASRQLDLVQMPNRHPSLLRSREQTCGDLGRRVGGESWRSARGNRGGTAS